MTLAQPAYKTIQKQAQEIYASLRNTHGTFCHVIERRPADVKTEEAWEAEHEWGDICLGRFQFWHTGYAQYIGFHLYAFRTGKEAAERAKELSSGNWCRNIPFTYRIKRYQMTQECADSIEASKVWIAREQARLADGTYTVLPWANEAWFQERHAKLNHFAHVSVNDPGKVAFTRSDDDGHADRQTRMAAGRYLREYFREQLDALPRRETGATNVRGEKTTIDALQWYARTFNAQYGIAESLHFATTREEIKQVYVNGPDSCMGGKPTRIYECHPIHPCEVYAAGDLALAYLKDNDGRITARALVWPDRKVIGRTYGDGMALVAALVEQGYDSDEDPYNLKGARILRIPFEDGHVMPYIDGPQSYGYYKDDPKAFFVIGGGDGEAGYTHGTDYDPAAQCCCEHCGEGMSEDYSYIVIVNRHGDTQMWCESCAEELTFSCYETSERYSNCVRHIVLANGETVAECNANDYFRCHITGEYFHMDDAAGLYEATEEYICTDAAEGLKCDGDGAYWEPENYPGADADEAQQEQAA